MKDIIIAIIIISAFVGGVSFLAWGGFTLNQKGSASHFQQYLVCLEKTEKQTCDKIFYKVQTRE